jgi:hypothetical protein
MIGLLCFVLAVLTSPFKSKLRLEAENAVLRHQLIVLRRRLRGRVRLGTGLAFAATGVGNRVDGEGGHKSTRSCAR